MWHKRCNIFNIFSQSKYRKSFISFCVWRSTRRTWWDAEGGRNQFILHYCYFYAIWHFSKRNFQHFFSSLILCAQQLYTVCESKDVVTVGNVFDQNTGTLIDLFNLMIFFSSHLVWEIKFIVILSSYHHFSWSKRNFSWTI